MRKVLFSTLLGLALAATACKKENKEAAPAPGSAAPAAGSAAPAGEKTAEPTAPAGDTAPAAVAPGEPAPAADPGPRPASVTDADVAMAEKLVGTIEKMGNSLAEAGTDCAKMAASIKAFAPEMSAVMEEGKKFDERLKNDEAAKKWFEATYAPKVMGTMGKLMGNPCMQDKAVQEAMASTKMM